MMRRNSIAVQKHLMYLEIADKANMVLNWMFVEELVFHAERNPDLFYIPIFSWRLAICGRRRRLEHELRKRGIVPTEWQMIRVARAYAWRMLRYEEMRRRMYIEPFKVGDWNGK